MSSFRHEVELRHRVGPLSLDVGFTLTRPWTVLFAPSGAGKTTVLRLIAGLDRLDAGRVVMRSTWPPLEEKEFVLTDTSAKVNVSPHKRVIGFVSQRPLLFPHLSVLDNMQYKLRRGVRDEDEKSRYRERLEEVLELCRIAGLRDKMPHQLSGGERQRVALARAISRGFGRLLMLDEPFAGMDGALRDELIVGLKALQQRNGSPVLLVTHDVGEVFASGAEVMRMENGRIVAVGSADEVLVGERARLLKVLGEE